MERTHGLPLHENVDKVILFLAFAIGSIGGIALKIDNVHPLLTAAFAAMVLAVYAAVVYFKKDQMRLEPEMIGDNCYYLGFLFTLTSIAVTIYLVVQSDAQHQQDRISEVISGFGVALSSTIMGVFLRIMMMQFRVDLVAREREIRLELNEAARRFRDELAQSVQHIKDFSIESVQHAAERDQAMRDATTALTQDMRKQLQDATQSFVAGLSESFQRIKEVSIESARHAAERNEAMRKSTESLTQDMREQLLNATHSFVAGLSKSFQRIEEVSIESAKHAAERNEAMRKSTDSLTQDMRMQLLKVMQDFGVVLSESVKEQTAMAFAEIQSSTAAASGTSVRAIKTAFEELGSAATAMQGVSAQHHAAFTQSLAEMRSNGQKLAKNVGRVTEQIDKFVEQSNTAIDALSKTVSRMTQEMENAAKAIVSQKVSTKPLDEKLSRVPKPIPEVGTQILASSPQPPSEMPLNEQIIVSNEGQVTEILGKLAEQSNDAIDTLPSPTVGKIEREEGKSAKVVEPQDEPARPKEASVKPLEDSVKPAGLFGRLFGRR